MPWGWVGFDEADLDEGGEMTTSVVTLLVTDLVGSTALRVQTGEDRFDELRAEHDRLLREQVITWHGEVAKHTGDGMIAAFNAASDAVSAAVSIQQAFEQRNRRAPDRLEVRIGLSAGDVSFEDGDYFGTPPVEASRLCARADGGHILAADVVRILAGSRGGHTFVPRGELELKGLPPLAAVEVEWAPDESERERARSVDPRAVPMVGRGSEVHELDEELARAREGECRTVLVLGEPGIGKTRIVSEVLDHHRNDVKSLSARAYPLGATASLGLWTEAIERHLRSLGPSEVLALCGPYVDDLAAILPSVARAGGGRVDADPPPARLLAALGALLENISDGAAIVVTLDDVHLADGSSWEALNHLARNLSGSPILFLLTARPVELGEHKIGSEIVHALEQDGLLRRRTLEPLTRADLRPLAAAWFEPDRIGDPLLDWLKERSRGISLFAVGLLRALAEEGEADLEHPALRQLPEDLTERVHARLELLPPASRSLLELLAVVGYRVNLADVVAVSGQPLERTAETLDDLVWRRLVDETEDGRELSYELSHPLIQEAIYERIGSARQRALHRLVARVLVAQGHYGAAAGHFVRSADVGDAEAVEALREALRQAEAREQHHEALALLAALLTVLPEGDRRWLDVLDALSWQADWVVEHRTDDATEMAVRAMRNIEQLVQAHPDPERRATVKFHLGTFRAWNSEDLASATRTVEEARDLYEEAGEADRARLAENELSYLAAIGGDLPRQGEIARGVIAGAEAADDRFGLLQGLISLVFSLLLSGSVGEARPLMERALAIAAEDGKWYRVTYLHGQLAFAAALFGQEAIAHDHLAAGKAANPSWRDTLLPDFEIIGQWLQGQLPAAVSGAAAILAGAGGGASVRRFGLAFGALAAGESGRLDEGRVLAGYRDVFRGRDWWIHSDIAAWAEGALAVWDGDAERGLAMVHDALERQAQKQSAVFGRIMAFDLAEWALDAGDTATAAFAAASFERLGPGDVPALRCFDEAVHGVASAFDGDRTGAVAALDRAAAGFASSGWPLIAARATVLAGQIAGRDDRAGAVSRLERAAEDLSTLGAVGRRARAVELLAGLGKAGKRARTAVAGPEALTKREREVAGLAAEGLSAKDIGARLFIGERTVETHLANAYSKLGVRSRVQLARRAAELDLELGR